VEQEDRASGAKETTAPGLVEAATAGATEAGIAVINLVPVSVLLLSRELRCKTWLLLFIS